MNISWFRKILFKIFGNRVVLLIFLLLILTGLCLFYADYYVKYQNHPTTSDILSNYQVGETVLVGGTVTQIMPGGFLLSETYHQNIIEYRVYSPDEVSLGDKVSLIGNLESNYIIISQKMLIENSWSYRFVLIRSFFAFIVLLFIFNHYWKFNKERWEFIRRKQD